MLTSLLILLLFPFTSSLEENNPMIVIFHLSDDTPAGAYVGNVYLEWRILQHQKKNTSSDHQISLLPTFTNVLMFPDKLVHVDQAANLTTKNPLDRDALCDEYSCCHLRECHLFLECHLFEGTRSQRIPVRLIIFDLNDHAPSFENFTILEVPESSPVNEAHNLPRANDKDSPEFGVHKYDLQDPSSTFKLDENQLPNLVRLLVAVSLNRQKREFYPLILLATDGGSPPLTGTLSFTVVIIDVNDMSPKFTKEHDNITLMENHGKGTILHYFNATDGDEHENGRIVYSISPLSRPVSAIRRFHVDPMSGALILLENLDYESREDRRVDIRVIASDQGRPPMSATSTLTIWLLDENDHKPILTEKQSIPLQENVSNNTLVKAISIEDKDEISRNNITCQLESSKENFYLERYSPHLLGLLNARAFDYEREAVVRAVIVCVDDAPPTHTVTATLTVAIFDVNDNTPQWVYPKKTLEMWVPEDMVMFMPLLTLNANDLDSGNYGRIRYNITSQGDPQWANYFTCGPDSGQIALVRPLDREKLANMAFFLHAWDSDPEAPRHNTTSLLIHVTDTNDHRPKMISPPEFQVDEDAPLGTMVGQLVFSDPDAGENGTVVVQISKTRSSLGAALFSVDPLNHTLRVRGSLDRETHGNVSLTLIAHDLGSVLRLTETTEITVVLRDTNDHVPILVKPPNATIIGTAMPIPQNTPSGTRIVSVRAQDDDVGENSHVTFSLLPNIVNNQTQPLLYRIDPLSNVILSQWSETQIPPIGLHEVRLRVCDSGIPHPLCSDNIIYVNISHAVVGFSFYRDVYKHPVLFIILVVLVVMAILVCCASAYFGSRTAREEHNKERQLRTPCPQHPQAGSTVPSRGDVKFQPKADNVGMYHWNVPVAFYSTEEEERNPFHPQSHTTDSTFYLTEEANGGAAVQYVVYTPRLHRMASEDTEQVAKCDDDENAGKKSAYEEDVMINAPNSTMSNSASCTLPRIQPTPFYSVVLLPSNTDREQEDANRVSEMPESLCYLPQGSLSPQSHGTSCPTSRRHTPGPGSLGRRHPYFPTFSTDNPATGSPSLSMGTSSAHLQQAALSAPSPFRHHRDQHQPWVDPMTTRVRPNPPHPSSAIRPQVHFNTAATGGGLAYHSFL